jgi:hypothetical protein
MSIESFESSTPQIAASAFVHPAVRMSRRQLADRATRG